MRPDSDAAARLHPGDEIVKLEGFSLNRADLWVLDYDLEALEPRGGLHFQLRGSTGPPAKPWCAPSLCSTAAW
ncbi:MAG: hypothetical protein ACRD1E_11475 [Terriglobales bacterium]